MAILLISYLRSQLQLTFGFQAKNMSVGFGFQTQAWSA